MKTWTTALWAICVLFTATSARAQVIFSASGKLTCYEDLVPGPVRFNKIVLDDELAAEIAGSGPMFEERFALTFNGVSGDFVVVQRCDGTPLVAITDNRSCSAAGQSDASGANLRLACLQDAEDWGATPVDGTLLCLLSEKVNDEGQFSFKGPCQGAIAVDGDNCWLQLKVGKPFVPDPEVGCPK